MATSDPSNHIHDSISSFHSQMQRTIYTRPILLMEAMATLQNTANLKMQNDWTNPASQSAGIHKHTSCLSIHYFLIPCK